ncbi:MAG: PepSY-associated TM helix domain-containing protein [Methylicorpusculum sp.]|uniref:PepSY-associated TM helix domain-containing protein n=1 Tax=Methylicorpusculum sp. TaxID=2713644 RepID=UPI0027228EDF|nr:PepSY-associated TM helix domain-containing protein [Methylicorpusculum sp.]MDO8938806.1 PepSY-associated TM helix domain-containing protein [Methylicorpusculum sp.]MDP2202856.1 PepSY-associated TM helix domain-containing protein [Methylicorpusculum sp.]
MQLIKYQATFRAKWLVLHRYLALSAGLLMAIIGLTGSVSLYRDTLDKLFNPALAIEHSQDNYQSLDKLLDAVKKAHPDRHGAWTLEMPDASHDTVTAWFEKPYETTGQIYAPLMVSINPYTAEVVASRLWGQTAMTWLLDWHKQLAWDALGWQIVGGVGLLMVLSVLSGLYLWWPARKHLFAVFSTQHNSLIKFAFDAHRLIGLLSAVALLSLALTGLNLSFPQMLESLTGSTGMSHGGNGPLILSTAVPNNRPVRLSEAAFIAKAPFPKAELRRITTPSGVDGTFQVNLRQGSEINQKHPFTMVWIDRWSGHIKEVRDPAKFSTGEKLMAWMWPVHTGEALGASGRFIWFLSGISLVLLYVSGVMRWLHRHGWISDQALNFSKLKTHGLTIMAKLQRVLLMLWRLLGEFIRYASPIVIKALTAFSRKISLMWAERPHR